MPTAHFHRETQMQEAVAMHVGAVPVYKTRSTGIAYRRKTRPIP